MKIIRKEILPFVVELVLICLTINIDVIGETISREKIIRDYTVVAPGFGSDGVLLNEDIDSVLKRFGRNKFKLSKPHYPGELFKNVFNVDSKKKLYFEYMYYNEENKYAACVFGGKVVALIGFDRNRVTIDSVKLQSGINNYIFSYGNRNLHVIRSDSNGIYIYPDRGIAVIDDGMNDSIDLYIIFAIERNNN